MAAGQAGSASHDYPRFINGLASTQFNVVTGYRGPGDMFLAVERGEADGVCGIEISTFTATRPGWLAGERKGHAILQVGLEPNPKASALGFPSIWNYVKPEDKPLAELIVSQQVFQRPFVAPPGTPDAQLRTLRAAFMAALNDSNLLDEAKKKQP
jgi:hypothetical protein